MAASAARIAEVLAGLRGASARLRSGASLERSSLPIGIDPLDVALGGGLPRGRLSELTGRRGSGRLSVALGAVAAAQAAGELVAMVDVADAFDPRSAQTVGVMLDRLLWVRPATVLAGLRALDSVLAAGGFGVVLFYACGVEVRVRGESAWVRLQQRAAAAGAVVLVVADRPLAGGFAAVGLETQRRQTQWGGQGSGQLFDGLDVRVHIARSKLGLPGDQVALSLGWEG